MLIVPKEIFDLHYWILAVFYPLFHSALILIFAFACIRSPYRAQFAFLTVGAVLALFGSSVGLFYKYHKLVGSADEYAVLHRALWIVQAIGEYISMFLYLVGFVWLAHSLTKIKKA